MAYDMLRLESVIYSLRCQCHKHQINIRLCVISLSTQTLPEKYVQFCLLTDYVLCKHFSCQIFSENIFLVLSSTTAGQNTVKCAIFDAFALPQSLCYDVANFLPMDINSLLICSGCPGDRKSTRLNSSHQIISYAVFCLKKKKKN